MKKKAIYGLVYFAVIYIICVIMTHNEYVGTALIINLWFSIPMTISYFVELLYCKKVSNLVYFIIAIVNTIILFIMLCIIGSYILYNMYIPF